MTADTLAGDLLVLALSNAWLLLLAVPAFALGAAVAWWLQRDKAAAAHAHACAREQDVVALQHKLQQVADGVALAQLEVSTEWERP